MIEQQGQVVSTTENLARVRLGGTAACPICDAGRGCGAGLFGRLLKRRSAVIEVENPVGAGADQAVVVGLPEGLYLRLISRLYLLPLLAGLAGAVFGHYMSQRLAAGTVVTDLTALSGALIAVGAVLLRNRSLSGEFLARTSVHLLRVVEQGAAGQCLMKDASARAGMDDQRRPL